MSSLLVRKVTTSLLIVAVSLLSGCGANGGFGASQFADFASSEAPDSSGGTDSDPVSGETGEFGICSSLSLQGVSWPTDLTYDYKRSLALALNISGSFEGRSGWSNLTNNFDDQGMSFGLLNQNFGQGSLQPMWIKMRDRYPAKFAALFTSAHHSSILGMLSDWEEASASLSSLNLANGDDVESFEPDRLEDGRLSSLDRPFRLIEASEHRAELSSGAVRANSAVSDSVAWSVNTLYTDGGKTFQSTWKSELTKLGSVPEYVSIQIESSQKLHARAIGYMSQLKLTQLRSYLFLFDIGVQNGSLYQADIDDYTAFFGSTPNTSAATETARLNKILELRLRHVRTEYVSDVRIRKSAIINGTGKVHGVNRNFEKEYCFDRSVKL